MLSLIGDAVKDKRARVSRLAIPTSAWSRRLTSCGRAQEFELLRVVIAAVAHRVARRVGDQVQRLRLLLTAFDRQLVDWCPGHASLSELQLQQGVLAA